MKIKRHIPNFITSLNLLSGCVALAAVMDGNIILASGLVFLAAVFDFLDGAAARMLGVHSPFGRELDSLADVVSFGAVPGLILFTLIRQGEGLTETGNELFLLPYFALLIPVFSALRLATFNLDTSQTFYFKGVPTPANALMIASLPLISLYGGSSHPAFFQNVHEIFFSSEFLALMSVILSLLLVARIPLISMKFRSFAWKENRPRYIFLGCVVLFIVFLGYAAIPLLFLLYLIISLIFRRSIVKGATS